MHHGETDVFRFLTVVFLWSTSMTVPTKVQEVRSRLTSSRDSNSGWMEFSSFGGNDRDLLSSMGIESRIEKRDNRGQHTTPFILNLTSNHGVH
jgi:hypothetical protein